MTDDILFDCETCDAAVRIAALEAENEKLRAANIDLRCALKKITLVKNMKSYCDVDEAIGIAAAALKETGDE